MELLAIGLVILTISAQLGHRLCRKWLMNQGAVTDGEILVMQCGMGAVMCLLWYIFLSRWWEPLTPFRANASLYWIAIVGTTVANIAIQYVNVRATRLGDLTYVTPIMAMTPGLVVVGALLLGEKPSMMGYAGIALIVGGAYVHAREGSSLKEYLQPLFIWTLFQPIDHLDEVERKKRFSLRFAYTGALSATVGLLCDGLLARHGNIAFGVMIELISLTIVYALLSNRDIMKKGSEQKELPPLWTRVRSYWPQMLTAGIFFGTPFILITTAFRLAPISYIGSLKRLSIPLTMLLALWFLGERTSSKRRLITGAIITAGAVILTFDPTPAHMIGSLEDLLQRMVG